MFDSKKMAAIGDCFGRTVLQNIAKMGVALNGVISFQGRFVYYLSASNTSIYP